LASPGELRLDDINMGKAYTKPAALKQTLIELAFIEPD
jgi:hypothetical protein